MFLLPLLWKGAAMLASVIVAMQYSGLTIVIVGSNSNFRATLGFGGTEWFQRTLDWTFSPSVISGGDVLYAKANRFKDMPYVPIPFIDSHLVFPLGHGIMRFKNDEDDEPPSIEYDWFDVDVEGSVRAPVALPMLEPIEHVQVPLVYLIRRATIRLIGFDPAPTPLPGYFILWYLFGVGTLICSVLLILSHCEYDHYVHNRGVPLQPDWPLPHREREPWWIRLLRFFIPRTLPPIVPWDLPFR
ncbi:hypothetical protein DAEQUDRAFT_764192 [Daedalea quercina L-15889]|uniref:Uncharacterized protein n=1 Tax=Daedalea quercina L-15889 TaxID=1314783 RepID=A0A165RMJ3_9APHY|nr:hypothetical protein DAEQUDRAFT_764192 [Daedalea quercina L-15889]